MSMQNPLQTPALYIAPKRSWTRVFLLGALFVVSVMALALYFSSNSDVLGGGRLVFFDEDYSDSFLGWLVAIPILILTFLLVGVVLAATGVVVVGTLAMALVATVVALLFAFLLSVLPFALLIAIPILAFVGLLKLLRS
jgi:ABC-type phosphate/phosphonate transport system permease subunit